MHVYVIEPQEERRSVLRECVLQEGHTVTSYSNFGDVPRMPRSGLLIAGIDLIIFGPGVLNAPSPEPLFNHPYFAIPKGTTIKQVRGAIEKARVRLHGSVHTHPIPPQPARPLNAFAPF